MLFHKSSFKYLFLATILLGFGFLFRIFFTNQISLSPQNFFFFPSSSFSKVENAIESTQSGILFFGPFSYLPRGEYKAYFTLKSDSATSVDLETAQGKEIAVILNKTSVELQPEYQKYKLDFSTKGGKNHQFRVNTSGDSLVVFSGLLVKGNLIKMIIFSWQTQALLGMIILSLSVATCWSKLRKYYFTFFEKYFQKNTELKLFLIAFSLPATLIFFSATHPITGDEPHYLLFAKDLAINHSLNLKDAYNKSAINEFPQILPDIDNHLHPNLHQNIFTPHHGYGLSALLALPSRFADRKGAQLFLIIIFSLTVPLIFKLAKRLGVSPQRSLFLTLFFSLCTPYFYYSYSIYPAIVAAFIVIFYTYILHVHKSPNLFITSFSAILLTSLSFLGPKFLIFPTTLIPFGLYLFLSRKKTKHFFILGFSSFVSLFLYFLFLYNLHGSLNPLNFYQTLISQLYPPYTFLQTGQTLTNVLGRIPSYLFDLKYGLLINIPVLLLIFLNLKKLISNKKHRLLLLATIACSSVSLGIHFAGTWGGTSPVMRPLVPYLPLYFVLFILSLETQKIKKIHVFILSLLFLWSALLTWGRFISNTYVPNNSEIYGSFFDIHSPIYFNLKKYPNFNKYFDIKKIQESYKTENLEIKNTLIIPNNVGKAYDGSVLEIFIDTEKGTSIDNLQVITASCGSLERKGYETTIYFDIPKECFSKESIQTEVSIVNPDDQEIKSFRTNYYQKSKL